MKKIHILVIQNRTMASKSIELELVKARYEVSSLVFSGEDTIPEAEIAKPDLVLMNIKLYDKTDGIQVIKQIRGKRDIPIIIIIPCNDSITLEKIKSIDPIGYIQEPFEFRELEKTIEIALNQFDVRKQLEESENRDATEYKLDEEDLCQSEKKFRTLADQSPNMIFINKNRRVVYANRKCEEIMGYTQKEFYSDDFDFFDLIAPESLDIVKENFTKHANGKDTPFYEYTLITREGKRIDGIHTTKLIDFQGEKALLSIITDITESKKAEEKLRRSEDKYKRNEANLVALLENTNDKIWSIDKEYKLITFNSALKYVLEPILGVELRKGMNFVKRNPPEEQAKWIEWYDRALTGEKFSIEVTYKLNNIDIYDETSFNPIYNNGQIAGVSCVSRDITKRKEIEKELKASEYNYKDLVEHSNDLICTHDLEGNIISANPAGTRLIGYPLEKILSMNLRDFLVPEHRYKFQDYLEEIKNKGSAKGIMVVETSTGKRRTWEYDNTLRKEGIDKPIVRGMSRDITDRLVYEEQLRKLKRAVEQSPASILITNTKGNIEYVNPKCCSLSGYTTEELIGNNPKIFQSGKTSKEVYQKLWNTITSGDEWRGELLNKKKDGSLYWESASISSIRNARGKITHFLAVNEDITERKLFEKKLKDSEEHFRSLYENAQVGIYQTTPDGKVIMANPAFIEMLEYNSLDELKELDLDKDLYCEQSPLTRQQFKELIEEKGVVKGLDEIFKTRSGKTIFVSENARAVKGEDGKVLSYEGTVEDITNKKLAEEALIVAKEKAEEMNKLKTNFLANMSHELRTPLIGILGYADIIAAEADNVELKEMAKVVKNSGERLSRTLNSILDLARIESEQIEKNYEEINVNDFLIHCKDYFEEAASSKGLWINVVINKEPIYVVLDKNLLKKITNNILSNAIKYTNKGGIVIKANYEKYKHRVELAFVDTGVGITKENLELIFDPFRQVSEGLNREFEGTGLGLTVTKKLVELLHGNISVESELGKGSIFKVELPCNGKANKCDDPAVSSELRSAGTGSLINTAPS